MIIPVIYNIERSIIPISQTSFRKQDLASGAISYRRFSSSNISVTVTGYNQQNFIVVNESSPGCFNLSLNCGNFRLQKREVFLDIKVLYKGEVRKSFQVKVKYPTINASFHIEPSLSAVKEWSHRMDIGTLRVKPALENVGSEWWQYNNQCYLFIKTPDNIVCCDKTIALKRVGSYYRISLQPKQQRTLRFEYLGGDRCGKGTEKLYIQYYVGDEQTPTWLNASQSTILIRPLAQSLSLHPILKTTLVNVIGEESPVILDCHVNESNNLGFKLNGFNVFTDSTVLEITNPKILENEINFVAKFNLNKIVNYPLAETPIRITVGANDVESKFINLSYGSCVQSKNDYFRIDIPNDTFEINMLEGNEVYPETLQSDGLLLKLIQKKLPKVKIHDLSVILVDSSDLVFDNGAKSLKIETISQANDCKLVIKSVRPLNPSHTNVKGVLRLSLNNSAFLQDIKFTIKLKNKIYYKPNFKVKPICQESETIQPTSVLFTLLLENPSPKQDPNSGAQYDLSKIHALGGYKLIPLESVDFLKSGERLEYNVVCTQIVTNEDAKQELPPFELCYGNTTLYKREVKLIARKIERKHYDLKGTKLKTRIVSILYPGNCSDLTPFATIKYEHKLREDVQSSSNCIYVPLPDEDFKVKILTPGFTFGDTTEASSPISELKLYIEPNFFFKDDNIIKIEELVCEIEYSSQYRPSERRPFKVQVMPLKVTPKMIVSFGDLLLFPSNNGSVKNISLGKISYLDSDLKSKKLKNLGSFLISNVQRITRPPVEGIISFDIIGESINGHELKSIDLFPIGVNKPQSKLLSNQSNKVDLLLSWPVLGELLRTHNFKDNNTCNYIVHLKITSHDKEQFVDLSGILISKRNDNIGWYSLDLGTTGIVVAKKDGTRISLVEINDNKDSTYLEQDSRILSSLIGINVNGESNRVGTISLIRTKRQNGASEEILPAAKFVVDQNGIPNSSSYSTRYTGYKYFEDNELATSLIPDNLVTSLYRHILSKLDGRVINRLTLTYPNTYTRAQVKKIKDLIRKEYPNLDGYINAVPESDAALAHYLNLRSKKNTLPEDSENIIIFDMGAGTLDICYVKFVVDADNRTGVAKIERKIGIPVAGDYLNYAIYLALKDHVGSEVFENGNSRRQILEEQKTLPKLGKTDVLDLTDANINTQQLIDSESVQNYLEYCGKRVFEVLFGKKDWKQEVDTIVFTGRASKFKPLRDYISQSFEKTDLTEELSDENIDDENHKVKQIVHPFVDTETISDSELKQSVAIGAIEYTQAFSSENEANEFKIVSRNQYMNLYLVYETYGKGMNRIIRCDKIIDPMSYDWDGIPVINGTKTQALDGKILISVHPQGDDIILVQSLLDESDIVGIYESKRIGSYNYNLIQDDCFINEVFRIPVYELGDNLKDLSVSLRVSKDNDLRITINSDIYTGEKIKESIEDNRYFNVNRILITCDIKNE